MIDRRPYLMQSVRRLPLFHIEFHTALRPYSSIGLSFKTVGLGNRARQDIDDKSHAVGILSGDGAERSQHCLRHRFCQD